MEPYVNKKLILCFVFFYFFIFNCLLAHEGPPYPIVVDHAFNQSKLSIWADPDTGEGTFSFYIEGGNSMEQISIELEASPADNLEKKLYAIAQYNPDNKNYISYIAKVPFDREALWNITFKLKRGEEILTTKMIPVEVTPPGPTRWEFAIFLIPFVIIGFIWVRVLLFKRKKT